MNILALMLQLVSGAAGGYFVSAAFNKISLGPIMSAFTGMLGGEIGGKVLVFLTNSGADSNASDVQIFLALLLGAVVGGAMLTALAGGIRQMLTKRS